MNRDKQRDLYFKWLLKFVCNHYELRYFNNLMNLLYSTEFYWSMEFDENCAVYGIELREQWYSESGVARKYREMDGPLEGPCSVLELMISLAIRCETEIMTNFVDNNTSEWFWKMVESLGLETFDDGNWDEMEAERILRNFLERKYSKNGKGSLFYIPNSGANLRETAIWWQMNYFLRGYIDL